MQVCRPVTGDMVACVGQNRKMIIFKLSEMPELSKGKGVILQRYKDGGLSDAITFNQNDGLLWTGRLNTLKDITPYLGTRAGQGRLVPLGFPRSGKF
jgi:topoisomerase IV subunit A